MNVLGSDKAMQAMEYALRGLERRRNVIANNVANSETPGFRASRVDFETNLRRALERGYLRTDRDAIAVMGTADPAGINGNNVRLELELTDMVRTNLLQDVMVNTYNAKLDMIRAAIGAR